MRTRFGNVRQILEHKVFPDSGDLGFHVKMADGVTKWMMKSEMTQAEHDAVAAKYRDAKKKKLQNAANALVMMKNVTRAVYYIIAHDPNEERNLDVVHIPGKGYGVIAKQRIPANTRIAVYPGFVVRNRDLPKTILARKFAMYYPMMGTQIDEQGAMHDYEDTHFVVTPARDDGVLFDRFKNAIAPHINEPGPRQKPNVAFVRNLSVVPGQMEVWTVQDISPGTELIACYNDSEYHRTYSVSRAACKRTSKLMIWGNDPTPRTTAPKPGDALRRNPYATTPPARFVPILMSTDFGTHDADAIETLANVWHRPTPTTVSPASNNTATSLPARVTRSGVHVISTNNREPLLPATARAEATAAAAVATQLAAKFPRGTRACSETTKRLFLSAPIRAEQMIQESIGKVGRPFNPQLYRAIAWLLVLKAHNAGLSINKAIQMAHDAAARNDKLSSTFRDALSSITQVRVKQNFIKTLLGNTASWKCTKA